MEQDAAKEEEPGEQRDAAPHGPRAPGTLGHGCHGSHLPGVETGWLSPSSFSKCRGLFAGHTGGGGGLVAKPRLTLCDPMDSSLPGSSVHGIL